MTERMMDGRSVRIVGDVSTCEWLLLEPVDTDDRGMPGQEADALRRLCPDRAFALACFTVDWQNDLTPWPGPVVFRGQPDFGDGAARTLAYVTDELIPALIPAAGQARPKILLGGYSLAGLFALWAGYQSGLFDGIAAASPSVWYPGWTEYASAQRFQARAGYLSLGDREGKTRNPLMKTVDEAIRAQYSALVEQGVPVELEWNAGNHFADAALRIAKGFAWCIKQLAASDVLEDRSNDPE